MSEICTTDDLYVREIPRWVVELSDGTFVFQDDDRPGLSEPKAWLRLKRHLEITNLHVIGMRLQFRSNVVWLPSGKDGYYFCRCSFGVMGLGDEMGNPETFEAFVAGHVDVDKTGETPQRKVFVSKYKIPELTIIERDVRELIEGPTLILNY